MKNVRIILFPILLIGSFGAVLFWADLEAAHKNRKSSAKEAMNQLTFAFEAFFEEYQRLPLANITPNDAIYTSKTPLMASLIGLQVAIDENPKLLPFFEYKKAHNGKNGLILNDSENAAELVDPWGNPYHLLMDYDGNNQLTHPRTGETLEEIRTLVWSPGPDGKTGTPECDEDNIYSH